MEWQGILFSVLFGVVMKLSFKAMHKYGITKHIGAPKRR